MPACCCNHDAAFCAFCDIHSVCEGCAVWTQVHFREGSDVLGKDTVIEKDK